MLPGTQWKCTEPEFRLWYQELKPISSLGIGSDAETVLAETETLILLNLHISNFHFMNKPLMNLHLISFHLIFCNYICINLSSSAAFYWFHLVSVSA